MLVLSRKCGEQIMIPEQNIVLTVLEVRGAQVRVGIEAPTGVPIFRQEVWQRLKELTEPVQPAVEPGLTKC